MQPVRGDLRPVPEQISELGARYPKASALCYRDQRLGCA